MGNCTSDISRRRLDRIDERRVQLGSDLNKDGSISNPQKECKVLLLGCSGSGKSTVRKQLEIAHQSGRGFTHDEVTEFRSIVHKNTLDSIHEIISAVKRLQLEWAVPDNKIHAEDLLNSRTGPVSTDELTSDKAQKIYSLWRDPVTSRLIGDYPSKLALMDNASYFLSEALRTGAPNYMPTSMDILCLRSFSYGIREAKFKMGSLSVCLFDTAGQRNKWIHCFESVSSIIFCAALSDYDQVSAGHEGQNRLMDAIGYFDVIVNSRWFLRTSIILLLNKRDIFEAKLSNSPLEIHFSDYTGGREANKAARYILWKFMQVNRAQICVYPFVVQATDIVDMRRTALNLEGVFARDALSYSSVL